MGEPLVIGIDTKTRAFHWVASQSIPAGRYGWVSSEKDVELARHELFVGSARLLRGLALDQREVHVFCEEPLVLQNGKTSRLLAMAAAAVQAGFFLAAEVNPNMWWYWVDAASWKRSVLGRGAPPQEYVGDTARSRVKDWIRDQVDAMSAFSAWRSEAQVDYDTMRMERDLYDAWCLKAYGLRELAKLGMRL